MQLFHNSRFLTVQICVSLARTRREALRGWLKTLHFGVPMRSHNDSTWQWLKDSQKETESALPGAKGTGAHTLVGTHPANTDDQRAMSAAPWVGQGRARRQGRGTSPESCPGPSLCPLPTARLQVLGLFLTTWLLTALILQNALLIIKVT